MDVLQHRQFEAFLIPIAVFLNYVLPSSDFSVFLPVSPFFNLAPHKVKTASFYRLFYRLLRKNLPYNFRYAVEENFRSAEQIGQLTISRLLSANRPLHRIDCNRAIYICRRIRRFFLKQVKRQAYSVAVKGSLMRKGERNGCIRSSLFFG